MVLSLVIGDGCLHYIKNNGRLYGGLTIDHGKKQADYQKWKAELLDSVFDRKVNVRQSKKRNSIQVSVCHKRLKAWRKFCYPGGKKDITKILKFINNPVFTVAVWLMDDGYVESSISKLANGNGARFRIFNCKTPLENQQILIDWFIAELNITPKIKIQKNNKNGKSYPFLKFTQSDSLLLWEQIRPFVLQFKSMRYKFRYIEQVYQKKNITAQSR